MRFPGLNKKQGFFALLEKQAQAAVDAAKEFQDLVNDFDNLASHAARIKEIVLP